MGHTVRVRSCSRFVDFERSASALRARRDAAAAPPATRVYALLASVFIVSGFGGTAQIVLDDNTIAKTPDAEVRLVMAHEIGHYVLAHVTKGIVFDTLITGFGFLFVGWGTTRLITRFGDRWNVSGLRDIGAFPVFWGLLMLWGFLALPLSNSIVREQEAEADMYGINASQHPLGLAEFMIRDADARQLDPSSLVESVFYNHPSARNRIFHAMRWRAEHLRSLASSPQ